MKTNKKTLVIGEKAYIQKDGESDNAFFKRARIESGIHPLVWRRFAKLLNEMG